MDGHEVPGRFLYSLYDLFKDESHQILVIPGICTLEKVQHIFPNDGFDGDESH